MDENVRELERQVLSGDLDAIPPLLNTLVRHNQITRPALELMACLFEPAIPVYQQLNIDHTPKLVKTLWQELGPTIGVKLGGAWLNYPFYEIFNNFPQWEEESEFTQLEIASYKKLIEDCLLSIQNYTDQVPLDSKIFKKLNIWINELDKARRPGFGAASPHTDKIIPGAGYDSTHYIVSGSVGFRALSNLYQATALLRSLQLASTLAKRNTFYKTISEIIEEVTLARFEIENGFLTTDYSTSSKSLRNKIFKEALKKTYGWVALRAMELLLRTTTRVKTGIGSSRDIEYYKEALKAKRYSHISVYPHIGIGDESILVHSKLTDKIFGAGNYVRMIVWTTSKEEARARAEKVCYKLFGFIPSISIYPRTYGNLQQVISGKHEDAILDNEDIQIPADVFRERTTALYGEANQKAREANQLGLISVIKSRPDLYEELQKLL